MDRYTKLSEGMDKMAEDFNTRMSQMERDLREASTMSMSSSPPDISTLSSEFTEFRSFTWNCLNMLRSQMEQLLDGQDRHEMGTRRKVLLLHGVSEKADEEPGDVVSAVLRDHMKMSPECLSDIRVAHRLGSRNQASKARPLLVRFSSFAARTEAWKCKTALKGTGITMTEFLTKARHTVFMAARKHFGVLNSWTTEGRIVLLLPDKTRRKVESMAELLEFTSKFPPAASSQPGGQKSPAKKSATAAPSVAAPSAAAATGSGKRPPSIRRKGVTLPPPGGKK